MGVCSRENISSGDINLKYYNPCYSPECCCNKHDTFGLCSGGIHTQWSHIVHILNQYSCHLDMCLILHCMSYCLVWTPFVDNVHSCQFEILKKITSLQKGLQTLTCSMKLLGAWPFLLLSPTPSHPAMEF